MSTNVYNYDERWYYDDKPAIYHGWAITTSNDVMSLGHFKNRKICRKLEKAIQAVLPKRVNHVLIAACLALKMWGTEAGWQRAEELIQAEFSRVACEMDAKLEDKLDQIVERFDKESNS
jgi:ferritin-like metal-binding protein YciE